MDDTWFEIRPSTYIINATYQSLGDDAKVYCTVGIVPQQSNIVILGAPFMKNYYMIFDLDADRLGVSNIYSTSNLFQGPLPVLRPDDPKNSNGGKTQDGSSSGDPALDNTTIYLILIGVILLLSVFIVLLVVAIWYFGFRTTTSSALQTTN